LQARRADVAGSLVAGGAGTRTSVGIPQRRLLDALVVIEIALALVLLVGSGLLVRAYGTLRNTDPGFRTDSLFTFQISLPRSKYPTANQQRRFQAALIERLGAVPGVTSAGIITCLPFTCHWGRFVRAEKAAPRGRNEPDPVTLVRYASADYFETIGIKLLRGRFFRANEGAPGAHPVIINEQLAKHLWPDVSDPIGKRMIWNGDTASADWMTVVGVVRDVRHYGLVDPMIQGLYGLSTDADSTLPLGAFGVAVRSATSEGAVIAAARSIVRQLDPEVPLINVESANAALDNSVASRRIVAFVFVAFGLIALTLALGGIYAVLSYVVGRRRQEIGIRMALGARRGQVIGLVVRQGLRLVAIGVVIGIPIALFGVRSIGDLLLDVSARDPLTYIGAVVLLAATAIVSALIPARRAAGVDPKTALGES